MPRRSRSRSRDRDRKERRDKDRDRHSKTSRRSRSRSRSPRDKRDSKRDRDSPLRARKSSTKDRYQRSPSPDYLTLGNVRPKLSSRALPDDDKQLILDPAAFEGKTEEEIEMMKKMRFNILTAR